jgi:hypothetical protein
MGTMTLFAHFGTTIYAHVRKRDDTRKEKTPTRKDTVSVQLAEDEYKEDLISVRCQFLLACMMSEMENLKYTVFRWTPTWQLLDFVQIDGLHVFNQSSFCTLENKAFEKLKKIILDLYVLGG